MKRKPLAVALLALAALFVLWFARDEHVLTGLLVFASPPLLLAIAAWRGWPRAGFVAGVLALFWVSHGVMQAWSEPVGRGFALGEIVLALAVVYTACIDGIRARFGRK